MERKTSRAGLARVCALGAWLALGGCGSGADVKPPLDAHDGAVVALQDASGERSGDASRPDAADPGDVPVVDAAAPPSGPPPIAEPNCEPADYTAPPRAWANPSMPFATTLPPLHVEGRAVVDSNGVPVALRGVNFGSWLMGEAWFSGMGPYVDEEAFMAAARTKAQALGVGNAFFTAYGARLADWLGGGRGRWVLFQEMRAAMYESVPDDHRAGVDAFWRWADQEPWVFEEESLWRHLAGLHGADAAEALRGLYTDAFITELDVERVAALGLNLIRIPFWYRALEDEGEDGAVRPRAAGWKALDDVVAWARRHGLYLILDLHGAPGGQSAHWHQGLRNGGFLWKRASCADRTAHLWAQVAAHFRGEAHIAAFGLLNEPDPRGDREAYERVHQRLYDAVRAGDPDRIVVAEDGYQGPDRISSPREMGWTNAMFSIHAYLRLSNPFHPIITGRSA